LSQHGEGTQSLAVICLFDAFLDAQLIGEFGEGAIPILTLEEPEAHLHPSAVRAVGQLISNLGGQKIITTHSGDLLASVPLTALRRLRRVGNDVEVFRIRDGVIDPEDLCRLDHHIRRLRGGVLFARVWILVEGETDEVVIQEAARILGHDLFAMGVCCFKFTELGIEPYIRLADELGIHWIATADNDPAGQAYAATAHSLLGDRVAAEHVCPLPVWDIETYLCLEGYGHVYQATISAQKLQNNPNPHPAGTHDYWQHVVNKLQPNSGKPARVRTVIDEMEIAAGPGVPQYLRDIIELAITKSNEVA
jgi:putative ATP-dependent endonuclease of OLD family